MSAFENVKKNPVMKLDQKLLSDSDAGFKDRVGFFLNRYTPNAIKTKPPNI